MRRPRRVYTEIYCNPTYCKYIRVYTVLAGWPATVPLHRLIGFSDYLGPIQARGPCPKPLACMGPVCQCGEKTQTSLSNHANWAQCSVVPWHHAAWLWLASVCCGLGVVGWACQPRAANPRPLATPTQPIAAARAGLGAGAFALALVWWWAYPMAQGACTGLASMPAWWGMHAHPNKVHCCIALPVAHVWWAPLAVGTG